MASITAVELGADTCVLVRTSVRRGAISVSAMETLDPGAFPGVDSFTAALSQARRALKLPRRCRAVVWGLPEGADRRDVAVQPLLAPLVGAGWRVERVVSPCNALAALARLKDVRGHAATCWLAINRGGVAIVVVRPGKQLYSYSFAWDSSVGTSGSQARLLQRYSLVAILGPEVKRAMAEARKHGVAVDAVVTCGNLPDLRSLTMPLIEELDVEVETLDSLEGLVVKPAAAERLAEAAPAIRLACAGLIARGTRAWDENRRHAVRRTSAALRVAAVAAGVLAVGYAWYTRVKVSGVSATAPRAAESRPAPPTGPRPAWKPPGAASPPTPPVVNVLPPAVPTSSVPVVSAPPAAAPKATASPVVSASRPPAVSEPAKRAESSPVAPKPNPPVVSPPPPVAARPDPAVPPVSAEPRPSIPTRAENRIPAAPPPVSPRIEAAPASSGLNTPAVPADKPEAARKRPLPALLKDLLPRVTTILVAGDRRFATIDNGQIIGIGDAVGRRIVAAIDERTVVLQEPSGVQIRVGLGGRVVAVGRSDR